MGAWAKQIAANLGASNSSGGAYYKRIANRLGAQGRSGNNWVQRIGQGGYALPGQVSKYSYKRALVDFNSPITTAYGHLGSYGRMLANRSFALGDFYEPTPAALGLVGNVPKIMPLKPIAGALTLAPNTPTRTP